MYKLREYCGVFFYKSLLAVIVVYVKMDNHLVLNDADRESDIRNLFSKL